MKRFDGGYVRGGASTLYMSRSDVVQTLAMLFKGKYDVKKLLQEAHEYVYEEKHAE